MLKVAKWSPRREITMFIISLKSSRYALGVPMSPG